MSGHNRGNCDYPTCNEGLSPSSLGKTGSVVSTTSGKLSSGFHFRNGTMEQHFAESPENFGKFLFHLTFCPDFRLNGSLSRIQQFPDFLETFPRNFLKLNEGKCTHPYNLPAKPEISSRAFFGMSKILSEEFSFPSAFSFSGILGWIVPIL